MTDSQRVIVAGASMAGLRAAEALRKTGFNGELLVIGDEPHMPYNRPPLSKEALADGLAVGDLIFRLPAALAQASWRLGTRVQSCDLGAHTLTLDTGESLYWDALVIATGVRPRRIAAPGPAAGRHVLRTVDDVHRLRSRLQPGTRLVIIGAGFLACEVAASARTLGAEVDVVAPESVPMQRALGHALGADLQRRHEQGRVRFHLGRHPVAFNGTERVDSIHLSDGTELSCDVVLEAVGCLPNTEWLAGNGLDLTDGVLCDNTLRVQSVTGVVACGDIARFPNPLIDEVPRRVEHWMMALETGRQAGLTLGRTLLGADSISAPFTPIPSFWSDQANVRLQSYGAVGAGIGDIRILEGAFGEEVALGYHRDNLLVGVVLVGMAGRLSHYRSRIAGPSL